MPPFPERESSILAKLKKKRPDKVSTLLEPKASNSRSSVTDNNKVDQTAPSVSVSAAASVQNHVCRLVIISDNGNSGSLERKSMFVVVAVFVIIVVSHCHSFPGRRS